MSGTYTAQTAVLIVQANAPADAVLADSDSTILVRRAKAGDTDAFEQLVIQHQYKVFRLAFNLLGDADEAKDATQEVLVRLWKHISRFDDTRRLSPWLYAMVLNVCRDLAKKRRRLQTVSLDEQIELGVFIEQPSKSDPEGDREANEQRQIVAAALKRLPQKERTALILRDIDGLSTKEVARILGSSEVTVRSQVSSARIKIKKIRDKLLGRSA